MAFEWVTTTTSIEKIKYSYLAQEKRRKEKWKANWNSEYEIGSLNMQQGCSMFNVI